MGETDICQSDLHCPTHCELLPENEVNQNDNKCRVCQAQLVREWIISNLMAVPGELTFQPELPLDGTPLDVTILGLPRDPNLMIPTFPEIKQRIKHCANLAKEIELFE